MIYLVFGAQGWIGSKVVTILSANNHTIVPAKSRAEDAEEEIRSIKPDRVISLIGRTSGPGFPNIDYLEQKGKLKENINDNLYAPVTLALICQKLNIHFTYLGTGCIFSDLDTSHKYKEDSLPDFFGSSYSVVKAFTDRLMHQLPVLNIRIRMPVDDSFHPRNFITKITSYKKVINIHNSMTVLPELLPIMLDMSEKGITGTINLCNPGVISHNEILEMYKEIVNPSFTWENFTPEEEEALIQRRSNNHMDCSKLSSMYKVDDIKTAVRKTLEKMKLEK